MGHSKAAPRGGPIIRSSRRGALTAFAAAAGLVLSGCAIPGLSSGTAPSPSPSPSRAAPTPSPSPTSAVPGSVWVLTPLGLRLHAAPGTSAPVVTLLAQSTRLTVIGSLAAGQDTWLHVSDHDSGASGWVLGSKDLVIARPVSVHIDYPNGYQLLYPSEWTVAQPPGRPDITTFASPAGAAEQDVLTVQVADDLTHLQALPTSSGHQVNEVSPILVYGLTTRMSVYQLDSGGFEMAVRFAWSPPGASPAPTPAPGAMRDFLFLYQQTGPGLSGADPSLFEQLLDGVLVSG